MPTPEIRITADGWITVCCGDDQCTKIQVAFGDPPSSGPGEPSQPPPIQPTPIKPTLAYAFLADALATDQLDVIAGHIENARDPETGVVGLAVGYEEVVRLDMLARMQSMSEEPLALIVGASTEVQEYA